MISSGIENFVKSWAAPSCNDEPWYQREATVVGPLFISTFPEKNINRHSKQDDIISANIIVDNKKRHKPPEGGFAVVFLAPRKHFQIFLTK